MTKFTLFAQPQSFDPALKAEREIFPGYTSQDEGRSVLITDIGMAALLTARKLYAAASLRLESYEPSGHEWAATLSTPSLEIALRCVELKRKGGRPIRSPRAFAVVMEFTGGQLAVVRFAQKLVSQLGRRPDGLAAPEEFGETFGVRPEDVSEQWDYVLGLDVGGQLREAFAGVRAEVESAASSKLEVADQARKLLSQAEGAMEEENFDLASSILETTRGLLRDARALAREEENRRERAADMISFVQTIMIKASQGGLDTSRAQKHLSEGSRALAESGDAETAIRNAMQARSLVELEAGRREQAQAALSAARSQIDEAREGGLEVEREVQLLEMAEKALRAHGYGTVHHYATTIRKAVSRMREEARRLLDRREQARFALDACERVMLEARKFGVDTSRFDGAVAAASKALGSGDLDGALQGAEAVRSRMEEAVRASGEALDAVQQATTVLNDAKAFIVTTRMEPYLERAWGHFRDNEYAQAVNIASMCRDMIEVGEVEEEPKIEVKILTRELRPSLWNRSLLQVSNTGGAHARNVSIKFTGQVEATRLRKVLFLKGGDRTTLEVGLKPVGAGELSYDVITSCARVFDGVGYTSRAHRWLSVLTGPAVEPPALEGEAGGAARPAEEADEKAETVVEEIYVVFGDGRLVFHEIRPGREGIDEMSLSSMLTAVQGFIKDSFKAEEGGLGKLEFGKLKMLLEHGKLMYRAVVLSGRVPHGLRRAMREALSELEGEHFDPSGLWDGNLTALEPARGTVRKLFEVGKSPGR